MRLPKLLTALFFLLIALPASAQTYNVEAGPIWNNGDAQAKCPRVCGGLGARWNGQWHTTVQGQMSVCACEKASPGREIQAGPIWNNADAQGKCPGICFGNGLSWSGQWRTTVQGRMSVCDCR
ncbi:MULTISPECIES: mannan-binding lectin [Stappiaceae]|nr:MULTISPECIES: mannan-binding lectin [Stappiaceae]MBO6856057.1 mannan-binding lectin [Roseibium sp.]MEC9418480.1 mannan-binding lectin [Pseudomonadota bacterium]WJS04357.1 mannan-binding lectin [Roseibium aggregatum]